MIGVFDSGFGGLTVLRAYLEHERLSRYDFLYLGDNAHAPYGDKDDETIYRYTRAAVDYLFQQGCELVILACNTASSRALRRLQQEFLPAHWPERRILGVIIPAAEEIAAKYAEEKVGLIGTRATITSQAYDREIKHRAPDCQITEQACPLLVPLVEEGKINAPETAKILREYLAPLKKKAISVLIPGCTHYPLLDKLLQQVAGTKIKILNTPRIVAEKTADYLVRHPEIESKLGQHGKIIFLTTGDPTRFAALGSRFLGQKIESVKRISLDHNAD